jgi:predicted nucleic-acid-binding Zn-ribbon protein
MELYTKVERLNCPRCGENAYLRCSDLEYIDALKFHFCIKCGYPDTGNEPVDPEKGVTQVDDIPKTFYGLCCLKLRNGCTEYYSFSGDTTDEIVSWFTSVLREPDIDPNGSYLNKWDRKSKTILRIGVDQANRVQEREEQGESRISDGGGFHA